MDRFEALLLQYRPALERWVRYRVASWADGEDLAQEICLAAYRNFGQLRDEQLFFPWLLGIARHQYAAYCRRKASNREISLEQLPADTAARPADDFDDFIGHLPYRDRQMLRLFYQRHLPQKEIARQLLLPVGTVKSRLHAARERILKTMDPVDRKEGVYKMKKLPELLPRYAIAFQPQKPFDVEWHETMGWFIMPRPGEKMRWGMYDLPSRKLDIAYDMEVTGKASVHGIEGVRIVARTLQPREAVGESSLMAGPVAESGATSDEWVFVAQDTGEYTRFLSAERNENGVRTLTTFLDGDEFYNNWGFGEKNCGKPVHLTPRGLIRRSGNRIEVAADGPVIDVAGRCTLTLGDKTYDTICVMDTGAYTDQVASEQYLDKDGRTLLWRRFNRDDWAIERYGRPWTELLPDNERILLRGKTYVHWYDCLCIRDE